jgi:hypothetical protein
MAIETRIQPKQTAQNIAYAVICLGLAIWGWYDYTVTIPAEEAAYAEFVAAEQAKSEIEKVRNGGAVLDDAQKAAFRDAEAVLAKYTEKPAQPAAYDKPVQLWLYIVGCGVLGTPWFLYAQWQLSRRRYRLHDDGSFECADGRFTRDEIAGIDLSRWMSKSMATVETTHGRKILLDDFKYKGVEDIVAAFAARFYPGEWTSDARPIGDPKSRDTKKALAEQAAADAGQDAGSGEDPAQKAENG